METHSAVASYLQSVFELLENHRQAIPRLVSPAELTARSLIAGGAFYLAGSDIGWREEGVARSGGLMRALALPSFQVTREGDVVWLSFLSATYQAELRNSKELERRGCLAVAFGPSPPDSLPDFRHWIDSLCPWNGALNFTRLANVLSLWTLTAELAAFTAREAKTLAFWQNLWVPEADVRDGLYKMCMFHDGVPQMEPVQPGALSRAYLDYTENMFREIRAHELAKIIMSGEEIAQRARETRPAAFMVLSHLMPYCVDRESKLFHYFDAGIDREVLEGYLAPEGLLVCVWHNGVPPDVWRAVRRARARAIWIVSPLPDQVDYEQFGDVFVDQHWRLGDCAVEVPGYDVRILPPSGLAQLFIYELLMRAASAR